MTTTYGADSIKIYLNGVLRNTLPWPAGFAPGTSGLNIGYYEQGGASYPYYFQGWIDDMRLYSRALSPEEVKTYYDSVTMPPLGVAAAAMAPEIRISPNPATDQVRIGLPAGSTGAEVTVLNTLGQPVLELAQNGHQELVADVRALPAGLYLFKVKYGPAAQVYKVWKQ